MANRFQFKQSVAERRRRSFSEEFKQKKVREIERKITTIAEISRQYEVSETSVCNWVKKYGKNSMKGARTIVESVSDTRQLLELKAKIAELERVIGQKQVQIEFRDKIIDLAEQAYGVDIKKKFEFKP
jgi:transposase